MVLTSLFLFNLFCALFPCVPPASNDGVELDSDPLYTSRSIHRTGRLLNNEDFVENPVIRTASGSVEGYTMKTISKRQIYAFEGIPYGESTADANRFQAPIPKSPWSGILPAKRPGIQCLQSELIRVVGQEDCLYLSIYTPQIRAKTNVTSGKLPIIIWLHGGAFSLSSGSTYGPHVLLDEDIILVTVNYRLGVLGFLSTGDNEVPGNNGLKDQALAIRWVYENIEAFGGNRTEITLLGQSSGAASTQMHMLSNMSRNYLSRAISMSGSVFHTWGFQSPKIAANRKARIAYITNCPLSEGSRVFVNCLRNMNPYLLVERQRWIYDVVGIPQVLFGPVVEPEHKDAFLTKTPEEHYRTGDVAKIPFLATIVKHEGNLPILVHTAILIYRKFLQEFKTRLPIYLDYVLTEEKSRQEIITEKISNFYLKGQDPTEIDQAAIESIVSDRLFIYPVRKSIQAHSPLAPTYSYVFNVPTKNSFVYYFGQDPETWGSVHADDVVFLLNSTAFFDNWKQTDKEYSVVQFMCNMIANFAATGEPNLSKAGKIWEPVKDSKNIRFLQIEPNDIKMIDDPYKERMQFWDNLNMTDMMPWI